MFIVQRKLVICIFFVCINLAHTPKYKWLFVKKTTTVICTPQLKGQTSPAQTPRTPPNLQTPVDGGTPAVSPVLGASLSVHASPFQTLGASITGSPLDINISPINKSAGSNLMMESAMLGVAALANHKYEH